MENSVLKYAKRANDMLVLWMALVEIRRNYRTMSMKGSFLDSFKLFSRWTTIFAFNNFSFPKSHVKKPNIKIKMFEKILTALKLCAFFGILITANILLRRTQKSAATTSITGYVIILLNVFGLSIFLTNLFIEFRYHPNIWAIISGFCNIDNMVSYKSYLYKKWQNWSYYYHFHKDEETWCQIKI